MIHCHFTRLDSKISISIFAGRNLNSLMQFLTHLVWDDPSPYQPPSIVTSLYNLHRLDVCSFICSVFPLWNGPLTSIVYIGAFFILLPLLHPCSSSCCLCDCFVYLVVWVMLIEPFSTKKNTKPATNFRWSLSLSCRYLPTKNSPPTTNDIQIII